MWTLLSPKVWIAIVLSAGLAFSHFQAYKSGKNTVQRDWDAQTIAQAQATVKLVQDAREKEKVLSNKVNQGTKKYEDAKKTTAAVTSVVNERVQHFQAELSKRDTQDSQSSTVDHGRTPERIILGYCATSFYQVGSVAEEHRQQIIALQDYIKIVVDACSNNP